MTCHLTDLHARSPERPGMGRNHSLCAAERNLRGRSEEPGEPQSHEPATRARRLRKKKRRNALRCRQKLPITSARCDVHPTASHAPTLRCGWLAASPLAHLMHAQKLPPATPCRFVAGRAAVRSVAAQCGFRSHHEFGNWPQRKHPEPISINIIVMP